MSIDQFKYVTTYELYAAVQAYIVAPYVPHDPSVPCGRVTHHADHAGVVAHWDLLEPAQEELARRIEKGLSLGVSARITTGQLRRAHVISNAFSMAMVDLDDASLRVVTVTPEEAALLVNADTISSVGHADAAARYSRALGREIKPARNNVRVQPAAASLGVVVTASEECGLPAEDEARILVCQYTGPRLPEGAAELPEGASEVWKMVIVKAAG